MVVPESVLSLCGLLTFMGIDIPSKRFLEMLVIAVVLFVLTASLAHSMYCHRKRTRSEQRSTRLLEERDHLGRTIATLIRSNVDYYFYRSWNEIILVKSNGDTVVERTVEIIPGTKEKESDPASISMAFMSLLGNEVPKDPSEVTFRACIKKVSGEIRAEAITSWETKTDFVGVVLLDKEYFPGESVVLRCEWSWPGYSTKLASGAPESHAIKLRRRCDEFECSIFIEKGSTKIKQRKLVADEIREFSDKNKVLSLNQIEDTTRHGVVFGVTELGPTDRFGVRLNWAESR